MKMGKIQYSGRATGFNLPVENIPAVFFDACTFMDRFRTDGDIVIAWSGLDPKHVKISLIFLSRT